MKRGNISEEAYQDILAAIQRFGLPVSTEGISAEDIYEVTKLDKKMDADHVKFILLTGVGSSVIDTTVTKDEMLEAIHTILK